MSANWRSGTRLPDDPEYWDRLAARSIEAALGTPRRRPAAKPWWGALSDHSFRLAASAALVLIGGALLLPDGSAAPVTGPHAARTSADPVLGSLLGTATEPPAVPLLLGLIALRTGAQ